MADINIKGHMKETIITIIGAGNFGTALSQVAAMSGNIVNLYVRDISVCNSVNKSHRNSKYMSDFPLSVKIRATTDIVEALAGSSLLILAIPAQNVCLNISIVCLYNYLCH